MTETKPEREKSPRLLAALEGQFRPKRYHREATLRPKTPLPANVLDQVGRMLPQWNWPEPGVAVPPAEELVYLDGNAAWIAAASSVRIAMEQLEHTGKMPISQFLGDRMPGYYLIRVFHSIRPGMPELDLCSWSDSRFVSPLGRHRDGFIWVCEPTLTLLTELERDGHWWSDLSIHDSWTPETKTNMRAWTQWVNAQRLELKTRAGEEGERAREVFKLRYAQAIEMLPGGVDSKTGRERSLIKRPDWYHAIIAQHRANQWRKVWKAILGGVEIVRVGGNDEVHLTEAGYATLLAMQDGKPPIWLDPVELGQYAVKKPYGQPEKGNR